jgi:hypothetical protein
MNHEDDDLSIVCIWILKDCAWLQQEQRSLHELLNFLGFDQALTALSHVPTRDSLLDLPPEINLAAITARCIHSNYCSSYNECMHACAFRRVHERGRIMENMQRLEASYSIL